MNTLPIEKRVQIINMLVEGSSMRAASRIADVSINTVVKLNYRQKLLSGWLVEKLLFLGSVGHFYAPKNMRIHSLVYLLAFVI